MTIDKLRNYIVIVNDGSGVIIQPADNSSTYILTAKHVTIDVASKVNSLIRFEFSDNRWIQLPIAFQAEEEVNYFEHPDIDAVILKIPRLAGFDLLQRADSSIGREGCLLAGYPTIRRNTGVADALDNSFRVDENLVLQHIKNNGRQEARISGNPDLTEIVGQSGGAVGKLTDSAFFLAGIQSQMADAGAEALGAVEFVPIKAFDALIAHFPHLLSGIYPAYMGCFSFLKEHALPLKGGFFENDVTYTRIYLRDLTQEIVDNALTPLYLKDHFKMRLLVYNQQDHVLDHKGLWIAWLEFLIILRIIKEQAADTETVSQLFKEYRLIYSSTTEDWARDMSNIVRSDFIGLEKGAKVIIATNSVPIQSIIPPNMVESIVRARDVTRSQMQIDEGISHPLASYPLIHIHAFQQHSIVGKAGDYTAFCAMNENELMTKLQYEFNQLFN